MLSNNSYLEAMSRQTSLRCYISVDWDSQSLPPWTSSYSWSKRFNPSTNAAYFHSASGNPTVAPRLFSATGFTTSKKLVVHNPSTQSVSIGDVVHSSTYQVLYKNGYGATSTVLLGVLGSSVGSFVLRPEPFQSRWMFLHEVHSLRLYLHPTRYQSIRSFNQSRQD